MIIRTAGQMVIIRTPPEEVADLWDAYSREYGSNDGATRDVALSLERGEEHVERMDAADARRLAELYEGEGWARDAQLLRDAAGSAR